MTQSYDPRATRTAGEPGAALEAPQAPQTAEAPEALEKSATGAIPEAPAMGGFARLFPAGLPRLVMFDLDGTLVDSVPELAAAIEQMLLALGRAPAGSAAVRLWVGNGARVLVRRALAGDLHHAAVSEADTELALALFMDAYAGCHGLTQIYPGVRDSLKWLRQQGVEMALITNKPERFVAPLLDALKIGRYFRWIIGGDTLAQQKPDPAGLLQVMKMAGVTPQQALFVGDSRSDVLAAHAAGVLCVALSYGYNHGRPIAEEAPALVIDDLRALLPGCPSAWAELPLPDPQSTSSEESAVW